MLVSPPKAPVGDGPAAMPVSMAPVAPTAAPGRRGPRVAEAKPWEPYNSDGSRNLGSYEVGAAERMVLLAHDLLVTRARRVTADTGEPFTPPPPGQVHSLARRLLAAADNAQARVRSDGRTDRMDGSHSRCRAAVRAGLEVYPVPWGASPEELKEWVEQLSTHAALLVGIAVALVEVSQ